MSWLWSKALKAEFERFGLEWEVIYIPIYDKFECVGSSPGESYYDGKKLWVSHTQLEWHLAHELAHYIVCLTTTPYAKNCVNYGFDDYDEYDGEHDFEPTDLEATAAEVTCGLLSKLHRPWRDAADDMNMASDMRLSTYWRDHRQKDRGLPEAGWVALKKLVRVEYQRHVDLLSRPRPTNERPSAVEQHPAPLS